MGLLERLGLGVSTTAEAEKLPSTAPGGAAKDEEEESAPATSTPAAKRAQAQSDRFRDVAQKLIDRNDTTAKSIATLGTTAVSALGIARIADLFPNPYGDRFVDLLDEPAPWAMLLGFALMVGAVLILARGFWRLQRPLVIGTDVQAMVTAKEIDDDEKTMVETVFEGLATANNVGTIEDYKKRGDERDAEARRVEAADPKAATRLRAEGEEIAAEVSATLYRARLNVLRHRSDKALRGPLAGSALVALLLGVLVFSIGADAVESHRTGELALAKTCAELRALETADEDKISDLVCGAPLAAGAGEDESSPQQVADDAVTALSTARAECRKLAAEDEVGAEECQPLERALESAASRSGNGDGG